ncbi:Integrase, catalytic core protein [Phytophthora megakarya]|uniref:Integrase, catalytic core protein n=1 Tax=Phytophthora megakarya TaxID=4795 RepID=A0A225W7H5_9STRA|nr:Integrase, catalytic core protein [Phytophthora megakarya]
MFVGETQEDWDLYLPRVRFAYRTSYHEALGDSPFFSLYGRDPILPLDLAFLNTSSDRKSNEVAAYRRKFFYRCVILDVWLSVNYSKRKVDTLDVSRIKYLSRSLKATLCGYINILELAVENVRRRS